jgi:hypothetical protein
MLTLLTLSTVFAEPLDVDVDAMSDQYKKVTFVIAASEKSYSQAVLKAATLAEQSGIVFTSNGVNFDSKHKDDNGGLTYPKADCENNGWDYPCYVSRGRWDEGSYITVEYSSAIQGFTPGLYVVIAASGPKDTLVPYFNTVKHFVPDAYMKTSSVYVGCMH